MKFILILTLSIAMIGVMVPDALGKTYVGEVVPYKSGEPYGFSIDYPNDWVIYDEVIDENLDLRIWEKNFLTTMRIIYIDDHTMPPLSDNEHIDLMNKLAKDNCNNDIFGNDVICYDFAHLSEEDNSIVYEIDGHKAKTTFYTLTLDYGDPNNPELYPTIRTTTNIFVGNDLWVIFSDTEDYVFEEYYDLIMDTITSLRFEKTISEQTIPEQITPEIIEKSKFKKYSNNKYNFGFMYPSEFNSHFKGVDSTPMIWKNDPHPELPWFKVWKSVKTIPEGLFSTAYEFKVYSDNDMSEYSQSELLDLLENSSINLLTDMCSPENCTVTKTDSNISTNGNGAKILDIIIQTVTDYENGVTQYITNNMRITILNTNNDILTIQHVTSSNDNFTHLFYEPHFTYMAKSLETQYIPKDSLKNTSTIFTAYGETIVTTEEGGGCLIATATYGSELAPQVQQLRELRDNQLLQTESGTAFMGTFNDIYYSFSPIIADYERENPLFKETVKIAITPMISSLSLMENAESESEVLSFGISVIALNLGMYLGVPAIVVIGIRKIK